MSLTDTQRAIHAFIADRIEGDGFAPSQAEIARAFGFKGVRAAQYHLEALEVAGILERSPGRARSLRLLQLPDGPQQLDLPANDDALRLPVLGQVAAGVPIGADIGSDQVVLMDRAFFSPTPDYLLKVRGDSMRDEGIFDGDVILVDRAIKPRRGHIVVAVVDRCPLAMWYATKEALRCFCGRTHGIVWTMEDPPILKCDGRELALLQMQAAEGH